MSVEKFTKQLYQLAVKQNVALCDSLQIMAKNGRKKSLLSLNHKVQKAATDMLERLANGETFSDALKACMEINFDDVYVQSVRFAENAGDLKKTISFLYERESRHRENRTKVFEACIYPFFIMIVAVAACIFLMNIIPSELSGMGTPQEMKLKLVKYIFILMLACLSLIFVVIKGIGENKTYEAFFVISFLIKNGMNVSMAIECAQIIVGEDSKLGRKFASAKEKISFGMGLEEAFNMGGEFSDALYFADMAGEKSDVFEKITEWMFEKDERKRRIVIQLLEPIFIALTGIFLLILVMNFFMPFLNSTMWA